MRVTEAPTGTRGDGLLAAVEDALAVEVVEAEEGLGDIGAHQRLGEGAELPQQAGD